MKHHDALSNQTAHRIELRELVGLMGRLPPAQREVLLLVAVEKLRYEEIAAVLAIPVGAVMSRISRGRETLRRMATRPSSPSEFLSRPRHTTASKVGLGDPGIPS